MGQEQETARLVGRIATVTDGYCFIGRATVIYAKGEDDTFKTSGDIFLHRNDCDEGLRDKLAKGLRVSFEIEADDKRGEGFFRAINATEAQEEALLPEPTTEVLSGLGTAVAGANLPVVADELPPYLPMKVVPDETVAQAASNKPLDGVPPDVANGSSLIENDADLLTLFERYLRQQFPGLQSGTATAQTEDDDEAESNLAWYVIVVTGET